MLLGVEIPGLANECALRDQSELIGHHRSPDFAWPILVPPHFFPSCTLRPWQARQGKIPSKFKRQQVLGMEFGEGDATKQKAVKKSAFSLNEGQAFGE